MKITILNGNPNTTVFDDYLARLGSILEEGGHSVTRLDLRNLPLRYCIGCWGCWVKTPGQCASQDASIEMDRAVINADFLLWASPLKMGFPSELLKRALDKHLPLIHPYMVVDHSEAHHRKRYQHYPRVGMLVEPEPCTDAEDLQIVADIHCRTALNFKTRLEFCQTTGASLTELAERITTRPARPLPLPADPAPTHGIGVKPPTRLALFNGSPRGRRGNTPIFLREIAAGFGLSETFDLVRLKETHSMVESFARAECILFGFPLYTDSMPGIVKHFIEGNGEGVRSMSPQATESLFKSLRALGAGLAQEGRFDPLILGHIAKPERFPWYLDPVFQVFVRLPMAHGYFDDMMKKNGVFEQRFARPFTEEVS
jgi:multimeric flavodoxin WrbA